MFDVISMENYFAKILMQFHKSLQTIFFFGE